AVQVQRWLGHHSPAFTLQVYVHLLNDDLGGALEIGAKSDPGCHEGVTLTHGNSPKLHAIN
ncbi:MAG: hypothetical protein KDB48_01510, partial [Solirubrobacterales bacterium]|nr:hypothetical protein [Solirubrobacterales bacterium]